MPEGPEILFWSILLKKKLSKCSFDTIESFSNNVVKIPKSLHKSKVIDTGAKGKVIWIKLGCGYYIHVHFGITGWFLFDKPETTVKYLLKFTKDSGIDPVNLYLEDKRRLSQVSILNQDEHDNALDKLGIDIFDPEFTIDIFKSKIESKNTLLCSFLLNQEIFCGIGNYIKNEVLYMSNLKVKIKTSQLDQNQISKLYSNILFVGYSNLVEMLKDNKIYKLLPKTKSSNIPKKLEIPYQYKIYGREKTIDGKKIIKTKVGGRDTYCIKELC
jgi:formamidopyrimidine-DNA glycosylase